MSLKCVKLARSPKSSATWVSANMEWCASIPRCSPADWAKDPEANSKQIAETFREACNVAESFGERLAAEGEICWGGMHSWKRMVELLEMVGRPETLGLSGRHGAHAAIYARATTRRKTEFCREDYDWTDQDVLYDALSEMTHALRPWTIDFHVAQNDATVKGSGSHDKTGRHCLPNDPNGKLDVPRAAGMWLRDDNGNLDPRHPAHMLGWLHVLRTKP